MKRQSCNLVGFLQQKGYLVSACLHLTSTHFQDSSAHAGYRDTAVIQDKKSRPHTMLQKIKTSASEKKERSLLSPGNSNSPPAEVYLHQHTVHYFSSTLKHILKKYLEATTQQPDET